MAKGKRVRQADTALFTKFPLNGRVPFKQVLQATWIASLALITGICFVLVIVFTSDGKPTNGNTWYQYVPTFIALGAVVLRGSIAALLGVALYQNLWQNVATPVDDAKESLRGETGDVRGMSLKKMDSLHSASRLAVGMLAYPVFKAGWIIGILGLAITSAVQPVLQSAVTVRQEGHLTPTKLPIYHPQFNGSLAVSDTAAMYAWGPTTISKRSAIAALMGENSGHGYTSANVTGHANFGPVKYLDVDCNIDAVPGKKSNANGWDLYNFTYRYPTTEQVVTDPEFDVTQFRDVSNISALSDGVDVQLAQRSEVEVRAVMFNNTHYLKHSCTVQTAIGHCSTRLTAGTGRMGDLVCTREEFINVDADLEATGSYFGPAGGVIAFFGAFLEVFTGKAVLDIRGRLNPGRSPFLMGALVADTDQTLVMPSDLVSHMQRVLWVAPLLARFGEREQEDALNVTMSVQDESNVIVYQIHKIRVLITLAVLLLIGLGCLMYLSFSSAGACGRLMRDSLVHCLTVAGPNGPAIKGACLASLDDILDKAGDEKIRFGVLGEATDFVSGHLGFTDPSILGGFLGGPVPGRWYGGKGHLRGRSRSLSKKHS